MEVGVIVLAAMAATVKPRSLVSNMIAVVLWKKPFHGLWKIYNIWPLPSMSSKDDITTTSNREMRFQQIARQCKYNSQPFQTRHLVQNTSQMHSKFKLQISTRGRKVLKRPPCSFKQDSNPERIYLEGGGPLLPCLTFSSASLVPAPLFYKCPE